MFQSINEDLLPRLPLPLAQICRRAMNAKTPLERHLSSYFLWEAALKLLGSVAVVSYAEFSIHDPKVAELLTSLARPALGHWWEFVRTLLPELANAGDQPFQTICELILRRTHHDLPRAAGLDAALLNVLAGRSGARSTVRVSELFDRLIQYRNRELGHGAAGQRAGDHYETMARALLGGITEVLSCLDVLANRQLVYVADVRRHASGAWLVEQLELKGESARRIESLELPDSETSLLPRPERVYLSLAAAEDPETNPVPKLVCLHPLIVYQDKTDEVSFLNSRHGRHGTEYLCYTSGAVMQVQGWGPDQRTLLTRVLGCPVNDGHLEQWASKSHDQEQVALPAPVSEKEQLGASPRRLGEFDLISTLGQGGMGIVYRAWQPSLGRQVALKCLLRSGDPKAEARFAREIHALGRVEHPHLVKIFTSGSEAEQWFYAMELIEGATLGAVCDNLKNRSSNPAELKLQTWHEALSTVCEEGRLSEKPISDSKLDQPLLAQSAGISESSTSLDPTILGRSYVRHIVELLQQIIDASHALHEAGVIHRDIKPGNIMVNPDGKEAVLMDLGLAQLADDVHGRLTRTRQFVGTLRYASPEQVLAVGGLDRRSDIYSLGVTLWELLTLRPMYAATEQTPTPELMRRIQYQEPDRARKYNLEIPMDLDAIILKCLDKEATRRYSTARELSDDLRRFLSGEPVLARPVGEMGRLWRWCKRNPVVANMAAALVLLFISGFALVTWKWLDADARKKQAEAAETRATNLANAEKEARETAEREGKRVQRNAYFNTITLAYNDWLANDLSRTLKLLEDCPIELRNWEWGYLKRLCHSELLSLEHSGPINGVAISSNGKLLACAGVGEAKIWDIVSGRDLLTLTAEGTSVHAVAFSPDSRYIAGACADKLIHLWDSTTGQEISTLKGHSAAVHCVAFSSDGSFLVSGSEDKSVKVWNVASGKEIADFSGPVKGGHTGPVLSVVAASDNKTIASAGADGKAKVWSLTGRAGLSLSGHQASVRCVAFRPDGKLLATASWDKSIKLWEASSGDELSFGECIQTQPINGIAFSPDGNYLASAGHDQTIKIWTVTKNEFLKHTKRQHSLDLVRTLRGHVNRVSGVAFHPDGKLLVSAGGLSAKLWDATLDQDSLTILPAGSDRPNIHGLALSPQGQQLAAACADGTTRLADSATGEKIRSFKKHTERSATVAFSPDGQRLATAGFDQLIKMWKPATGEDVLTFRGHLDCVTSVVFSPDGHVLASASADQTVRVWDTANGKLLHTLLGHTGVITRVAFSLDGKQIASAAFDQTIKIWDAQSGRNLLTLNGHTDRVHGLSYSPEGLLLASGSADNTVRLWDVQSGREIHTLRGHLGPVWSVAFTPDGQRLVSASSDFTERVWDVTTGQAILVLNPLATNQAFQSGGLGTGFGGIGGALGLGGGLGGLGGLGVGGGGLGGIAGLGGGNLGLGGGALGFAGNSSFLGGGAHTVIFNKDGQRLYSVRTDGAVLVRDASIKTEHTRPSKMAPNDKPNAKSAISTLDAESRQMTLASQKLREKLAMVIDFTPKLPANASLNQVIQHLSSAYDVNIIIDSRAFPRFDLPKDALLKDKKPSIEDAPVQLSPMKRVNLATVLWLLLNQVGGTFVIRGEFIVVTSPEEALVERGIPEGTDLGIVKLTELLPAQPPGGEQLASELQRKLKTLVNLESGIEPNTALRDALDFLYDRFDLPVLPILADVPAFKQLGILQPLDSGVRLPRLSDVRLDTVLYLLASQIQGTCIIRPPVIVITPYQQTLDNEKLAPNLTLGEMLPPLPMNESQLLLQRLREKLARPIQIDDKIPDTPLEDWLHMISDRFELHLVVDDKAFQKDKKEDILSKPVKLTGMADISLHEALKRSLASIKASYVIHRELLLIVPQPDLPTDPAAEPWFLDACLGKALLRKRQWEKAIEAYTKALALKPDELWVLEDRGLAQAQINKWDEAIRDLVRVINLENGAYFLFARDEDADSPQLERQKKLLPETWFCHACRAIAHSDLGQLEEGIEFFSKSIELQPSRSWLYYERGRAQERLERWAGAAADYSKVLELQPNNWFFWYRRALVYQRLDRLHEAIADCSKASELTPAAWEPWCLRATIHFEQSLLDRAIADYTKALEWKRDDWSIWADRAFAFAELGQWQKASADLTQAINLHRSDANLWRDYALLRLQLRDSKGYRETCSRMLKQLVDTTRSVNEARAAAWTCVLAPDAVADYKPLLELAKGAVAANRIAPPAPAPLPQPAEDRTMKKDETKRLGTDRTPLKPAQIGNNTPAEALSRQSIEEQRTKIVVREAKAAAQKLLSQDPDGASDLLKRIFVSIQTNPDLSQAVQEQLLGELNEALQAVAKQRREIVLEQTRRINRFNYANLKTLAAVEFRAGQFQAAGQHFQEAMRFHENGGEATCWLFFAMTQYRIGKTDEAKKWWGKAIDEISSRRRVESEKVPAPKMYWSERLEIDLLRAELEAIFKASK